MNRSLQNAILLLYTGVRRTGVLSTRPGRRLFELLYGLYKRHLEADDIRLLRSLVRPGTSVIDVGANIGFFTIEFARWTSEGGRVYAFEPEPDNFRHLVSRLRGAGLSDRVEAQQSAVADVDGELRLKVMSDQPADHHLSDDGIEVRAVRLDTYIEEIGHPEISLIKIDVQGAEDKVLEGAARTLTSQHPAIYLEVGDEFLQRFGSTTRQLLERTASYGYEIHSLSRQGISEPLELEKVLEQDAAGTYMDLLLLPRVAPPASLPETPSPSATQGL